ncbi:MAG: radical SAM family heme chaperone HemW [Flavobacteriales bacterium]|nr:radical SAM family heme chaperone HemW [Flavobacteriales bacterium]MDW8431630.1 radical SAM family heme chaperone HemW [Flavobacteriales bacterium]
MHGIPHKIIHPAATGKPLFLPKVGLGVYIHIPFCKRACHYCDFYFSTQLRYKKELVQALAREARLRQEEWAGAEIHSLYFGGGTPSLLEPSELADLLDLFHRLANPVPEVEITLEVNPEDVNSKNLATWKKLGINRLSLGLQSLQTRILQWMNRGHSGPQGLEALKKAGEAGFDNINVDIIFAIPGLELSCILNDLREILKFQPTHISCYELTCEPRTAYAHEVKTGKIFPVEEAASGEQFLTLSEILESAGYNHYEISNYARPGFEAIHNRRYWEGLPVLGLGPSAVSFDGRMRTQNVAHNIRYMTSLQKGVRLCETEILTPSALLNEYLLTRLRLQEGLSFTALRQRFGPDAEQRIRSRAAKWSPQVAEWRSDGFRLTRQGRLLADHLAADLFEI